MSRTHRALAMLALSLALVGASAAVAAAQPAIEDQNDRLLRNLQATQAERIQTAHQLARSMERNFKFTPMSADTLAPAPTSQVAHAPQVDVVATLLLGLIGGLVGGGAAIAGWTAVSRRHGHRAAATV